MISDKLKSEYELNTLLFEIEGNSFDKWYEYNYFNLNIKSLRDPAFQDELKRRLDRIHELSVLVEFYEHLESMLSYDPEVDQLNEPSL